MKPGDLYKSTHPRTPDGEPTVAQVMKTWNKRDIDPECPESVAIISMVQYILWCDGQHSGTFNIARHRFNRQYTRAGATQ